MTLILDSLNDAIVFVDTNHVIRYLNVAGKKQQAKWGNIIGKSLFDCHNANSCQIIRDCFARLQNGEEEILFTNNQKPRVYVRGVRNKEGNLIGYYERYEPSIVHDGAETPKSP